MARTVAYGLLGPEKGVLPLTVLGDLPGCPQKEGGCSYQQKAGGGPLSPPSAPPDCLSLLGSHPRVSPPSLPAPGSGLGQAQVPAPARLDAGRGPAPPKRGTSREKRSLQAPPPAEPCRHCPGGGTAPPCATRAPPPPRVPAWRSSGAAPRVDRRERSPGPGCPQLAKGQAGGWELPQGTRASPAAAPGRPQPAAL